MSTQQRIVMQRLNADSVKHPNYKMRGIIDAALKTSGSLKTAAQRKHFTDFMVQTTATAWLAGVISVCKCELTVGDVLRIAHTYNAPFEDHELTQAFHVSIGNPFTDDLE